MTFKSGRVGSKKGSGTGRTRENMDFPKTIRFTLGNLQWLQTEKKRQGKSFAKIINEMIERERGK